MNEPRRVLNPSNLRCRICNKVSHGDISGDYGDHSHSAFYEEDDHLGYLCHDCYVAYTGVLDDFAVEDEFDEFDDDYYVHGDHYDNE